LLQAANADRILFGFRKILLLTPVKTLRLAQLRAATCAARTTISERSVWNHKGIEEEYSRSQHK
jgi:hypothetical protein